MDPWGEAHRETTRGLIVDLCANCAGLQTHWVVEEHSTSQILFVVNLDRGVYERTFVVCCRCSVRAVIDSARYPHVVDLEDASTVSLSEGLSRTNPPVKKALDALDA